jgi:hypothetical protein
MAIANPGSNILKFATAADTTVDGRQTVVTAITLNGGSALSSASITEFGAATGDVEITLKTAINIATTVSFPFGLKMKGVRLNAIAGAGSPTVYVSVR